MKTGRPEKLHLGCDDPFVVRVDAALRQLAPELDHGEPTVVVALSGGPDSCALLAALNELKRSGRHITISACHVNHGLRGSESDDDERFCADLCSRWSIPFSSRKISNAASGAEGWLRDARYALLVSEAQRLNARWVATGHTLDDQVETVLFRLFRGTSVRGFIGIPARRALTDAVTVVRPMLELRRQFVLSFLERLQIAGREDSSNQSSQYLRNYIRLELLPRINQRFPCCADAIERFRTSLLEDDAVLERSAKEAADLASAGQDSWSVKDLSAQPLAIKRRILANGLRLRSIEVSQERLGDLLGLLNARQGRVSLNASWDAQVSRGLFRFLSMEAGGRQHVQAPFQTELAVPGITPVPGWGLCLHVEAAGDGSGQFPPASADEARVDLTHIMPPLVVRTRMEGDAIRPFGMAQQVKLKKYLHTHKPRSATNPLGLLVVADAEEVIWVPGVGLSEKVRVDQGGSHCLRILQLPDDS